MSKSKLVCKILEGYKECLCEIDRVSKPKVLNSTKLPHQNKLCEYITTFGCLDCKIRRLITAALEVRKRAYCPYTNKKMGAAFLTECGKIFTGCNIENVALTPTSCAERSALVKAISEGHQKFQAGVFVTGNSCGFQLPCGVCRQFIIEFAAKDIPIYVTNARDSKKMIEACDEVFVTSIYNLLPHSFTVF